MLWETVPAGESTVDVVTKLIGRLEVHRGKRRPEFAVFQARTLASIAKLKKQIKEQESKGYSPCTRKWVGGTARLKLKNLVAAH